jgi:cytidine deaminase
MIAIFGLYNRCERWDYVSMREVSEVHLDSQMLELYSLARNVSSHAYAPYSNFQVGAAILTIEGRVFCGTNVESASYGLTSCAERNAIFTAVAAEGGGMRIRKVAIFVKEQFASPCGACRQVMTEFGTDVQVIFTAGAKVVNTCLAELLPAHFIAPNRT